MPCFSYGTVIRNLILASAITTASIAQSFAATKRVWSASAAGNASTSTNWTPNGPFAAGDTAYLDGVKDWNCNWNVDIALGAWIQDAGYSGTVTVATVYSGAFDTLEITGNCTINGGTWTHTANTNAETYRLCVKVGGNLTVGSSGSINVSARGYNSNNGPGGSPDQPASYGGQGGCAAGQTPPATYGSISAPVDLGSSYGVPGGGAVAFTVSGSTTVTGSIIANGDSANLVTGTGGSVLITTATIGGGGTISANGGKTIWSGQCYATSGGGRVAVYLTQGGAGFSGLTVTPQAFGGNNSGDNVACQGAAGTVYLDSTDNSSLDGRLIIDNSDHHSKTWVTTEIPSGQTWTPGALYLANAGVLGVKTGTTLNLSSTAITSDADARNDGIRYNGGTLTPPSTLTISNWTLIADAAMTFTNLVVGTNGCVTHTGNTTAETYKVDLTMSGDLTVNNGGRIDVTGCGFSNNDGSAPGWPTTRQGGSYGGLGSYENGSTGSTYDSALAPVRLGSPGSNWGNPVAGGGAIKMTVSGALTISDSIKANGNRENFSGSGGSIYLTAGTISGTGIIDASGGASASPGIATTGGGGRIAIYLTQSGASFSSLTNLPSAYGGYGGNGICGAAGTVYLDSTNNGTCDGRIIIDNYARTSTAGTTTTIGVMTGGFTDQLDKVGIVEQNHGLCSLTVNDTIRSYQLSTGLNLGGHTLTCQKFRSMGNWKPAGTYASGNPITGVSGWGTVIVTGGVAVSVAIAVPGADFEQGAGTVLTVEVRDGDGMVADGDNTTKITFAPTSGGTITGVTEGTGDGSYGIRSGAETVTVKNGRVTIALNDTTAETFQVAITNNAGLSNPANDVIVVRPPVPPTVTIAPSDTSLVDGLPLTLLVRSTAGTRPFSFRWQKGTDTTSRGSDSTLLFTSIKAADSGQYLCIVSNIASKDTGFMSVHVIVRPKAKFSASTTNAVTAIPVVFTDSSDGTIGQWKWSFGDGRDSTYASRIATISHIYPDSGTFTCKLVVTSASGTLKDSATLVVRVSKVDDNPVRLDARVVSSTQIEVTFRNVKSISTNVLNPPYADKIDVWFSAKGLPPAMDTALSAKNTEILISSMHTAMGTDSLYRMTLTVPAPKTPADTLYAVWASPLWNNSRPSLYSFYNAAAISMNPVNTMTLAGEFRGNTGTTTQPVLNATGLDSIRVTLGNTAGIDTTVVSMVCLGWGFNENGPMGVDTIAASLIVRAGAQYLWGKRNTLFTGDTAKVCVWEYQIGRNNLLSTYQRDTIQVGWIYPANPCSLRVNGEVTASQVPLSWTSAGSVDSIRILYGTSQIPLGQPQEGQFQSVISPASVTDQSLTVMTSRTTHYYFAIQVRKYLHWSDITPVSRCDVITPDFNPQDSVKNTIKIDSLWFIAASNELRVRWHVQPTPGLSRNIGFRYSPDRSTATTREPANNENGKVLTIDSTRGETVIDMGNSILFDTTYYLGAWLQSTRGPWTRPTDSSTGTFATASPTWQKIVYFPAGRDTVICLNGSVLLRKETGYTLPPITDTITWVTPPDTIRGLVPVGTGFTLQKDNILTLSIGLRYDALPTGINPRDLGIYQDSAGMIMALYDAAVDTLSHIVWVRLRPNSILDAGNNPLPFFIMADTITPVLTLLSDTSRALYDADSLVDTFTIQDNISNVKWQLWYARDGEKYPQVPLSGTVCGSCAPRNVITKVSSWYVTEDNGIRALLIVSDGVHTDSVNLSRRAWRLNSDRLTTNNGEWTPLWSTAVLDSPGARHAMDSLGIPGTQWQYDQAKFRLFRWVSLDRNKDTSDKWIEYSYLDSSLFTFLPGRLMWLKTSEPKSIDLGRGKSISQKGSVAIPLNPNSFTDFSLPFRYDIKAGDIYTASNMPLDSLEFYQWAIDTVVDRSGLAKIVYVTQPLCITQIPDPTINNPEVALRSQQLLAYSVFCWPKQARTLRIPPVPVAVSTYARPASSLTKAGVEGWSVKLIGHTAGGIMLNAVYCGYTPGSGEITWHPLAPAFSPVRAAVYNRSSRKLYGHAITHRLTSGGCSFTIALVNDGAGAEDIELKLTTTGAFPANYAVRFYDPATGAAIPADQDETIAIPAGTTIFRTVSMGTSAYLDSGDRAISIGKLALNGYFVNRGDRSLRIRYQVPAFGISAVRFRLYDLNGKLIARQTVDRSLHTGTNSLLWNRTSGVASSGLYVLTMEAFDDHGRRAGLAKTVVSYVK
jgi:hypothetical protein